MNGLVFRRVLWGKTFPLACLSGGALLIMASDRLAHALVILGALVWVYCLSSLAVFFAVKIFPERGRSVLLVFLTSFIAGLYFLLIWIASPFCALQTFFVIPLVPMLCISSEIFNNNSDKLSLKDTIRTSTFEALIYGVLIVVFAIIREPFGFSSLSLPGGAQGIIILFSFSTRSFLPVRIIASSSGALLLLGYIVGLYRYYKTVYDPEEDKQ